MAPPYLAQLLGVDGDMDILWWTHTSFQNLILEIHSVSKETQSSVKSELNSDGLHNVFSKLRLGSSLKDVLSFKLEEPKVIPT